MVTNLILLRAAEVDAGGRVRLEGRRAVHIARVLRPSPGDSLRVGVVAGGVSRATVLAVSPELVELEMERPLNEPAVPAPEVRLVLALPRPKVVSRVVQIAASMGVVAIDLVNAWRVDRSYFASPRVEAAALAEDAWLGCEQGGHTWLPEVTVHPLLMRYLDAPPWPPDAARLVLHPRGAAGLESTAGARGGSAGWVAAVGAEGGWIDRELGTFEERGFTRVSLGPWVLRVEAAIPALLAQLALVRRGAPQ